jgi:D-alanyl-D-alanine-carboxypeptidase/D-alanyl-D-alanine-endopeptidase
MALSEQEAAARYEEATATYGPALERLARAYEPNPELRRDLLQEIHIALWRSLASFDGRCSLRTWIYRVAQLDRQVILLYLERHGSGDRRHGRHLRHARRRARDRRAAVAGAGRQESGGVGSTRGNDRVTITREAFMIRSTTAGMTVTLGLAASLVFGMTQTPADTPAAAPSGAPAIPSDQYIRDVLIKRIDTDKQSVGIIAGVIDAKGRRIITHGSLAAGDTRPLDGETVFEIGSITKVFTALLLADMVRRNEVALSDPVTKYLPAEAKIPERNGRAITLEDLASHTSGLPRMPSNFAPKDPLNPYADYGVDQLLQFLSSHTLTRDPGAQYEYSNLGAGLLGTVLARRAGMSYEALVESRITGPLGMKNTRVMLSPEMKARMATGHNGQLKPAANWDFPAPTSALAGAGGLRSTMNDMLIFLAANMDAVKPAANAKTPLQPAMTAVLANRRPTGNPGLDIALGWHVVKAPGGREIMWHNGGTGGFRSYMGFDPANNIGVVLLSNTSTPRGVDDIGVHLLINKAPLWTPPPPRKEATVDAALFDGYIGRYELMPNFILTISREGSQLFAQATNQGRFELYAESDRKYFAKVADIVITFEVDDKGKATSLVLQQGGGTMNAKRIE